MMRDTQYRSPSPTWQGLMGRSDRFHLNRRRIKLRGGIKLGGGFQIALSLQVKLPPNKEDLPWPRH